MRLVASHGFVRPIVSQIALSVLIPFDVQFLFEHMVLGIGAKYSYLHETFGVLQVTNRAKIPSSRELFDFQELCERGESFAMMAEE